MQNSQIEDKFKIIIIICIVAVMILSVVTRKDQKVIKKDVIIEKENTEKIAELESEVSRYRREYENVSTSKKSMKDSLVNHFEKTISLKNIQLTKLVKENKNLSSTFISFDFAEEFYGIGKNIKNLKLSKKEFESIKIDESSRSELEKTIEEKNDEIKMFERSVDSLSKSNVILLTENSKLESKLIEKEEKSKETESIVIVEQSKKYSIVVELDGTTNSSLELNSEANIKVKKYIIPFSQDGVFISGGYRNTNVIDYMENHLGYIGVGIEF